MYEIKIKHTLHTSNVKKHINVSGETVFRLAKCRNLNLKTAKLFRNWRNLAKFAQTSEIGETGRNFRNLAKPLVY